MRQHRPLSGVLRTALAVAFAFMSLFHGPVMTFANAAPPAHATMNITHVVIMLTIIAAPCRSKIHPPIGPRSRRAMHSVVSCLSRRPPPTFLQPS